MSDLLTRNEYQAIADTLVYPRAAFIDGKYQAGHGETSGVDQPGDRRDDRGDCGL